MIYYLTAKISNKNNLIKFSKLELATNYISKLNLKGTKDIWMLTNQPVANSKLYKTICINCGKKIDITSKHHGGIILRCNECKRIINNKRQVNRYANKYNLFIDNIIKNAPEEIKDILEKIKK